MIVYRILIYLFLITWMCQQNVSKMKKSSGYVTMITHKCWKTLCNKSTKRNYQILSCKTPWTNEEPFPIQEIKKHFLW